MSMTAAPPLPPSGSSISSGGIPPARRSRVPRWVQVGVVVAVIAIALLATLDVTGTYPFTRSSAPADSAFPTFDQAVTQSQPAANGVQGGPWQATLAVAVRVPTPVEIPTKNLTQEFATLGCNGTVLGIPPVDIVVNPTPSSEAAGDSAFWLLLFTGPGNAALGVLDSLGIATALFTDNSTACARYLADVLPFPSGAPDSPAVAGAADAAGGGTFLGNYPNATQLYLGAGGIAVSILLTEPVWEVVYSSCPLALAVNETGQLFNATVEGTLTTSHATSSVNCSLGTNFLGSLGPSRAVPVGKAI